MSHAHRILRFETEDLKLSADIDHPAGLALFWSELGDLIKGFTELPEKGLAFHLRLVEEGPMVLAEVAT